MGRCRATIALSLVFACIGCGRAVEAGDSKKISESDLYANLVEAYRPLQRCLAEKNAPTEANFIELATSDELIELEKLSERFLGASKADFNGVDRADGARQLIGQLLNYRIDQPEPERDDYKAFNLRVKVAASTALATLPSVGCEVSDDLKYWVEQTDDLDAFLSIATAYSPFQKCITEFMGKQQLPDGAAARAMVEKGLLEQLRKDAVRLLGAEDQHVLAASEPAVAEERQAALYIVGLVKNSDAMYERGSYKDKARAVVLMATASQYSANALGADCTVSQDYVDWADFVSSKND